MNTLTPASHDADLITAGYEPGLWDRYGNPVPTAAFTVNQDAEFWEREGFYFIELAEQARRDGRIHPEESAWDPEVRRRAGLLRPDHSPFARAIRAQHDIPDLAPGEPPF